MAHRTQHPWGTGEQLVGENLDQLFDRVEEKENRWDPVIRPDSSASPESTLNRQLPIGSAREFDDGRSLVQGGRPGGSAGYGQ